MCLFANASVMGADPARFQTQSNGKGRAWERNMNIHMAEVKG